jgi:CubicO group peptidase (beta-lactamase class C family)
LSETRLARRKVIGGAAGVALSATTAAGFAATARTTGSASRSEKTPRREQAVGGGLSKVGLQRMHDALAREVENGYVPGLVTLISRRDETHVDVIGNLAFDRDAPMQRDTLFRIASVTKPVTAAAAMMLIEEGELHLDDPVDNLLPELANRQVLRSIDSELNDTVPANRPITLRDVMTFRLGYGAVMVFPPAYPIQEAMAKAGVDPGAFMPALPPDELMEAYGSLPLLHQPGEEWHYNSGSDILGVLLARATRKSLGEFLKERIFDPLGMKDTSFSVPQNRLSGLPTLYMKDPTTGELTVFDGAEDSTFANPVFESGAGGLVSTVDDMLAFGQMMLNDGVYEGQRLLSRPSIELMTTDQITPEQKVRSPFFPGFWDNHGWGFGVAIITKRDDLPNTPGRYGWDGGYGTSWYVDPQEELIGILMTQRTFDALAAPPTYTDFWNTAYAAIDD